MRAEVEEMVEAVPGVGREDLGQEAVVVEAEARVAQPIICEGSLYQYRRGSCSPWVSLLTFVSTNLRLPSIPLHKINHKNTYQVVCMPL
jgi:hypothetical protein